MNEQDAAAVEHLRAADPIMRELIDSVDAEAVLRDRQLFRFPDHYAALVRSIVGQQLSTRAANAIYGRLIDRYDGHTPTPEQILADDPDELRTAAGLSRAKTVYLRSLAEHVVDGSLGLDGLGSLTDDEVIVALTAVKGIGEWSSHMFLMFDLGRPDVLAVGDLGIRRAVMQRYGLDGLPAAAELERIGEPWRPYRTLACLFLWRASDVVPV